MKIFQPTNKLRPLQLRGVQGHCLVNHFEVVGVGREASRGRPDDLQHGRPEVEVELLRGFDSRHADLFLDVEELPHQHRVVGNEGVCHQTIPEEHGPCSGGLYCQPVQITSSSYEKLADFLCFYGQSFRKTSNRLRLFWDILKKVKPKKTQNSCKMLKKIMQKSGGGKN